MRAFLKFYLRNPFAALLTVAVPSALGLYAAFHMSVDLFPNLDVPVANIITHYPAGDPEDIELLLTRPIEEAMRGLPGVRRIASVSTEGISQVTVEFRWGMGMAQVRQSVESRLSGLRGQLPDGAVPSLENIGATLDEVSGYVLTGSQDPIALGAFARYDLTSRLMAVDGVARIDVFGADRRAFLVTVPPESLDRMRIPLKNLADQIRQFNKTVMAGYVDRSSQEYAVRGDARLQTVNDVQNVPIATSDGNWVSLGAIAYVSEGTAPRHFVIRGDRLPAVAVVVHKQAGADTIRVARDADAAIHELSRNLPPGTRVAKYYDQSEIIIEARDEIVRDLMIGVMLAVGILWAFLGQFRPTIVVALTIPIAIVSTFAVMRLFGLSFNVVTLTALTLAIGMVVDDAIVVAENIDRRRNAGMGPVEAALEGTAGIAAADASGTFTTVAAFLPLALTTGLAALFIRPFGLTVSAALILSLVLSLTLVPVLFSRIPARKRTHRSPGALLLEGLTHLLRSALTFCLDHRWVPIAATLVALCSGLLAACLGETRLLPPIDEGAVLIEYVLPPGTSLEESNRIGDLLDQIAMADPDTESVYRRTGSPEIGYQVEGVNRGEILIKLKPKNRRRRSVTEILGSYRDAYSKIPGAVFLYHQPTQEKMDESFSGLPALFGVTVYGPDVDTLVALSDSVESVMASDPALSNIVNNARTKSPRIVVHPRVTDLARFQLTPDDVFETLQAARFGVEDTTIVHQREEIPVLLVQDSPNPLDLDAVRNLPIANRTGASIPLQRVADIQLSRTPATITRLNGERNVTLLADVTGFLPSVVSRLRGRLRSLPLPEGYRAEITGQYEVLVKTMEELVFVAVGAVLLIYIILVMQFHSGRQPIMILFAVPLSFVGALLALWFTGLGVDVSVGMGAITLIGISVNNAIVLTDFANRESTRGESAREALLSAATVRLRPILLTALTTIFALLPAAIGTSVGSQIYKPFAVTVIGGLVTGTLGTLIVIPTLLTFGTRSMSASSNHGNTPGVPPETGKS